MVAVAVGAAWPVAGCGASASSGTGSGALPADRDLYCRAYAARVDDTFRPGPAGWGERMRFAYGGRVVSPAVLHEEWDVVLRHAGELATRSALGEDATAGPLPPRVRTARAGIVSYDRRVCGVAAPVATPR